LQIPVRHKKTAAVSFHCLLTALTQIYTVNKASVRQRLALIMLRAPTLFTVQTQKALMAIVSLATTLVQGALLDLPAKFRVSTHYQLPPIV
jgi:hypothetical protein